MPPKSSPKTSGKGEETNEAMVPSTEQRRPSKSPARQTGRTVRATSSQAQINNPAAHIYQNVDQATGEQIQIDDTLVESATVPARPAKKVKPMEPRPPVNQTAAQATTATAQETNPQAQAANTSFQNNHHIWADNEVAQAVNEQAQINNMAAETATVPVQRKKAKQTKAQKRRAPLAPNNLIRIGRANAQPRAANDRGHGGNEQGQGPNPPVEATGERKRKRKRVETYATYIFKILKEMNPDRGISRKAMMVMNSFVDDILERIATEASQLALKTNRMTISDRDIQTAVRLLLPDEMAGIATMEGNRAVRRFQESRR